MTDKGNAPGPKKPYANAKYTKWLTEDGLLLLRGWARNGLTDKEIAHNCGVTTTTLYNWKANHVEIFEALKEGKEVVDLLVENALLKRALGYTYEEKAYERKQINEEGDMDMVLARTVTKEVLPDVTAQIFWLKNRKRDSWRDNERIEIERERLELEKKRVEAELADREVSSGSEFVIKLGDGLEDYTK